MNIERPEYINIGSTPCEEDCFPAGHPKCFRETLLYRDQLQREFPKGDFRVKWFPHNFGSYCEVVAYWTPGGHDKDARDAAFAAEGGAHPIWDPVSEPLIAALKAE